MSTSRKKIMILSVIFSALMISFSYSLVEVCEAQVSFTFTSSDTEGIAIIGDTIEFHSTLTNTGSTGDTYDIEKIEKPPPPLDWVVELCTGTFCFDESVNYVAVYLDQSDSEHVGLRINTLSDGPGKITIRVTSQANPSLIDSITFILSRPDCGDMNGSGSINLSDVIQLAKFYFGVGDPPGSNWASDVNCDASINLTDVILIANFYFGKLTTLNCCP